MIRCAGALRAYRRNDIIIDVKIKKSSVALLVAFAVFSGVGAQNLPGVSPGPGMRYATDAYPGFDLEEDALSPEKKTPKWFSWINGPVRDNPSDQFSYCEDLVRGGDESKAARQFDALVRAWPDAPEAPEAQLRLAELRLRDMDSEEAFREYMYMLDFYALRCDYDAVAEKLYKIAAFMRDEGKTIVFFRFKNTVDVRRAFEAAVLRAPGAGWAPAAMLAIGELREEEGRYTEAVKVYENLRNIHAGTPEAGKAVAKEAYARMKVLRDRGYNRARLEDTYGYLKYAATACDGQDASGIGELLDETGAALEREAYLAAAFYDSRMRTTRSAVDAYGKFLEKYPDGRYAPAVRARLEELKGTLK